MGEQQNSSWQRLVRFVCCVHCIHCCADTWCVSAIALAQTTIADTRICHRQSILLLLYCCTLLKYFVYAYVQTSYQLRFALSHVWIKLRLRTLHTSIRCRRWELLLFLLCTMHKQVKNPGWGSCGLLATLGCQENQWIHPRFLGNIRSSDALVDAQSNKKEKSNKATKEKTQT